MHFWDFFKPCQGLLIVRGFHIIWYAIKKTFEDKRCPVLNHSFIKRKMSLGSWNWLISLTIAPHSYNSSTQNNVKDPVKSRETFMKHYFQHNLNLLFCDSLPINYINTKSTPSHNTVSSTGTFSSVYVCMFMQFCTPTVQILPQGCSLYKSKRLAFYSAEV